MLIRELRDMFVTKYSLECQLKGISKINIGDKVLAFFISAGQQDIQRRLQVVQSSVDIPLGSSSPRYVSANTYSLPSAFGKPISAYVDGKDLLEQKALSWLEREIASGNTGYYYAIKPSGNSSQFICPLNSGTVTLNYYPDLGYYNPSVSATQDWGTFNGMTYSGNLILPDRYAMAMLYYMLSQVIPEYLGMYGKELKSLRESRLFSEDYQLGYNFAGLDEVIPIQGYNANTSSIITVVNEMDAPIKRFRVNISDTGSSTIKYASGWANTPTVNNAVSTIVINSSANEFENYLFFECNNSDFTWTQVGNSQIIITPSPSTGWGEASILINIFA
jgi:hypothetical protein